MKKHMAGIGVLFVLAFVIGLGAAPGLVMKAEAGPVCGGALCDYFAHCSKVYASCGECGGQWCMKRFAGKCSNSYECCGAVEQLCCGTFCP